MLSLQNNYTINNKRSVPTVPAPGKESLGGIADLGRGTDTV